MGCDGYIIDRKKPVSLRLTCYDCGERIYPESTMSIRRHENCYGNRDDKIPVTIEFDNLEER